MTHQENFLLISPSRLHIVKGDLRAKEKEIFVCYFETIIMMITWNSRTVISYYLPFSLCQVRSVRVVRVDMHFLKPPRPDNETTNNKTFALRNNDNSLTSAVAKKKSLKRYDLSKIKVNCDLIQPKLQYLYAFQFLFFSHQAPNSLFVFLL